jgi:hypothetical protein
MGKKVVLAEAATTGSGSAREWIGGKGYFMAEGTWGGGNAKLQQQSPRGTWMDVASASLTADGCVAIDIPAGQIRVEIDTATDVYAYAIAI